MKADRTGRRTLGDFEKLEKFNLLTPQGKAWLVTAVDPFHDSAVEMRGYPDLDVAPSIVQQVNKSFQVACPTALLGGPWDCHIVAWPAALRVVGVPATQYDGYIINDASSAAAAFDIGGVTALATATGQPTYMNGTAGGATGITNAGFVDTTNPGGGTYMDGTCRVIAYGVEVYNTTATLYKQGQVICYRQPNPVKESAGVSSVGTLGAGFTSYGNWNTYDIPTPPRTPAEALLLRTSKQWDAAEGGYVVVSMNTLNNYPDEPDAGIIVVMDSPDSQNTVGTNAVVYNGKRTRVLGATTITEPTEVQRLPFNTSGLYFSGLSVQTTLTVNVTWYIERFPTPGEGDLVVLSQPSAGWDQMALELYAAGLRDMPAGVMVKENPLGEWFQDVVHNIASAASPVANALSVVNPGFGIAGQLAGVIAKATERKQVAERQGGQMNNPVSRPKPAKSSVKTAKLGKTAKLKTKK